MHYNFLSSNPSYTGSITKKQGRNLICESLSLFYITLFVQIFEFCSRSKVESSCLFLVVKKMCLGFFHEN